MKDHASFCGKDGGMSGLRKFAAPLSDVFRQHRAIPAYVRPGWAGFRKNGIRFSIDDRANFILRVHPNCFFKQDRIIGDKFSKIGERVRPLFEI
jgi:hypothetical protein